MNRRSLLKSAASAATGVGLGAADPEGLWATGAKNTATGPKHVPAHFIETRDHASLFLKDWGIGRPVVLVHSWAVNSDLWQYQMIYLTRQGFRCIAFDNRGHGRSSQPGQGYDYDTLADDWLQ